MKTWLLLLSLCFVTHASYANPINHEEHVLWHKLPIVFNVPVGQERFLSFPGSVKVINDSDTLTTDKVSILNNAGTLYIKAKQSFESTRLKVVLTSTGQTILVDLSSVTEGNINPIDVVLEPDVSAEATHEEARDQPTMNVIGLTRYAIQQLYAPTRLLEVQTGISRTPMYTQKNVILVKGASADAFPMISWHSGQYYVTVILLRNALPKSQTLSAKQLLGCWKSAAFYPTNHVLSAGDEKDRTTLFVVSQAPFGDALTAHCGVTR